MFLKYNLLSILLGLVGWGLGIAAIAKQKTGGCSLASMSACAAAFFFQICEINRRVQMEDISALYDITDALTIVSRFLLVTTLALNLIALIREYKKERP